MISKSNLVHWNIVLALVNYISAHSWIDCVDVKDDNSCGGYVRGYDGHIDEHQTYKLLGRPLGSPACSPTRQAHPDNYDDQYPRALAEPGDTLKFFYLENGHVTKDRLAPDGRPNPKQYTIHWTGKPYTGDKLEGTQIMTRGDLGPHNQLGSAQNFDDGKCAEDNTRGRLGPMPCQGKITLPNGIAPGIYQFVWFWRFDKDYKGTGEEYTSCFDIEVTTKEAKSTYMSKQRSKKEAYLPRPYRPYHGSMNMTMDDEAGTFMGSSRLGALPKFSMEDVKPSGSMSKNDIISSSPSDRILQQLIGEIRAASAKPQVPVQVPAPPSIQAASMPQIPAARMPQVPAQAQAQAQAPAPAPIPPSAPQALPAAPQSQALRVPQLPTPVQALPANPQTMAQAQPMVANTVPSSNAGDTSSRAAAQQPAPAKPAVTPQTNQQQQSKSEDAQAARVQTSADPLAPQQKPSKSQTGSKTASDEKSRALTAEKNSQGLQAVSSSQKQLSPQEVTEAEKNIIDLQNTIKGHMNNFTKSQSDMVSQSEPNYERSRFSTRPEQDISQAPSRTGEEQLTEDDINQNSVLTDRLLEDDITANRGPTTAHSKQRLRNPNSSEHMGRFSSPGVEQLPSEEVGPLSRQDLEMTRGQDSSQPKHHHFDAPDRFEMSSPRENEPKFGNSNEGKYPFQINRDSDLVERVRPFENSNEDSQLNDNESSQRMRSQMHPQEELSDNNFAQSPHEHRHSSNGEPHQHNNNQDETEARRDHQHQTESEPHRHGHQHQADAGPRHDHHHETEISDSQAPENMQAPQGRMSNFPERLDSLSQNSRFNGPQELNDPRLAQERVAGFSNGQPQPQDQPIAPLPSAIGLRSQGQPRMPKRKGKLRASGGEDDMSTEEEEEEDLSSEVAGNEASGANMVESSSQSIPTNALSETSTEEKNEMPIQKPGSPNGPRMDNQDESDIENADSSADKLESSQIPRENASNPSLHSSSKLVNEESEFDSPLPLSKSHNTPLVDESEQDQPLAAEMNHVKPLMEESEQESSLPLSKGHNRPLAEENEQDLSLAPEMNHNRPSIEESEESKELPAPHSISPVKSMSEDSEELSPMAPPMNPSRPLSEESQQFPAPAAPAAPMSQPKPLHEDSMEESSTLLEIDPQVPSVPPHQTNVNAMEAIPDVTNLQSPLPEKINPAPIPPVHESTVDPQAESSPTGFQPSTTTLVTPQSEQIAEEEVLPE